MRILVTGFDAFGQETINPAQCLLENLPTSIQGADISKLLVPTVFHDCAVYLQEAMNIYQPDYVVCLGQAGGRSAISLERVAINIDDARIPDNEGNQPIDLQIQKEGAPAYFTQLPIKAIARALQAEEIPVMISNTAGTFVCNHLMYQVLYLTDILYPDTKAGFIHVPYLPSQVITQPHLPSMSLQEMQRGIELALETLVTWDGHAYHK